MSKNFASQTAIQQVTLEIKSGEFFSLLGPSGCGKTTLLRIIAGFETPTHGELYWRNQRVDLLTPQDRPFNMVFQKYALFPHMNVFDNVAFGLRVKKVDESQVSKRASEALQLVGLLELKHRYPDTLSGGQAQRVAVARALVNEPKILLLDEPLSALDQKLREHMQTELRQLQKRLGITFILVTHDQEEALALSDRIAVMNKGQIEQVASPRELYDTPKTHFVAQFVGSMGALSGVTEGAEDDYVVVRTARGELLRGHGKVIERRPVDVFVRPENVKIGASPIVEGNMNRVSARVEHIAFKGLHYELQLAVEMQQKLRMFVRPEDLPANLRIGQELPVQFSPSETFIFERPNP